jgi:3-oxoacyl-[acyl-carrier-protein] synthase II
MRALANAAENSNSSDSHVPPRGPSRPFDVSRTGFVMGEGAGILVLEELSSALRRNANIMAEVCGYGLTGDANPTSLTAPHPTGAGAVRSMRMALRDARLSPADVDYVNCHATSTPLDETEVLAIKTVFRETEGKDSRCNTNDESATHAQQPLYVSSTKGATGHLLGAAGAVETAFAVLALCHQALPPTTNLRQLDPSCAFDGDAATRPIHHVTAQSATGVVADSPPALRVAMKNSFGFGGTNATLVLKAFRRDVEES